MFTLQMNSRFGTLLLTSDGTSLTGCRITDKEISSNPCELLLRTRDELTEYLDGKRATFTIPVNPVGTPFQKKVWQVLTEIPYGQTVTYADIAKRIHKETACRAVGRACGLNPIWLVIPCHRVVGASGQLTGYAGGIDMKRALLQMERDASRAAD